MTPKVLGSKDEGAVMEDRLLKVGDGQVAVKISGTGTPPVVCLSSAGGAHEQWVEFMQLMQPVTSCVSYGRPGLGGSDPLPPETAVIPRGGRWAAEQLRTILQTAGFVPPYVLVTGSVGAFIADQYAALWPDEVAGLVLIDPTHWTPITCLTERDDLIEDSEQGGIQFSWSQSSAEIAEARPSNQGRTVVLSAAIGRWLRNDPQPWHHPLSLAEVDEIWQGKQQEWVERLSAVHVVADAAGHLVHMEEPK